MASSQLNHASEAANAHNVSPANTLSWQSCFWALVPIALNTMCQPSGRILGFGADHNFSLRSSPLLCAVSAVDTVVRMIAFWTRKHSFIAGLQELIDFRFKGCPTTDEGSFASLRRNQAFRLLLFIPGALPQVIKLYACRGIPWTQACCTAYLASYIVDEIMTMLADAWLPGGGTTSSASSNLPDNHGLAWLYVRGVLLTSYATAYMLFSLGFPGVSPSAWSGDATPFPIAVMMIGPFLLPHLHLIGPMDISRVLPGTLNALLASLLVVTLGAMLGIASVLYDRSAHDLRFELAIAAVAWLVGAVSLYIEETELKKAAWELPRLGKYFLILHLVAALLYYACRYDGTLTYKPGWTNWFG